MPSPLAFAALPFSRFDAATSREPPAFILRFDEGRRFQGAVMSDAAEERQMFS